MNSNEGELLKIKKKTSGWFKSNARSNISKAIEAYKPKIEAAKSLPEAERKKALVVLVNQATDDRHLAVQSGANSYGDPSWAAAATVESWIFELISGEEQGIKNVERIIHELHKRA